VKREKCRRLQRLVSSAQALGETTTSSFLNRQTTQTSSHEKRNRLSSKCRFDGEWKRSTVVTRVSRQTNEIADGLAMRPEPARSLGRWLVRCHLCLDDTGASAPQDFQIAFLCPQFSTARISLLFVFSWLRAVRKRTRRKRENPVLSSS